MKVSKKVKTSATWYVDSIMLSLVGTSLYANDGNNLCVMRIPALDNNHIIGN